MTDEQIKVEVEFYEKGLNAINKAVGDLRSDLESAGIDVSNFNKSLGAIERNASGLGSITKETRNIGAAANDSAGAIRGWNQTWSPAIGYQKQFQAELAKTNKLMAENAAAARNAASARTGSFLGQQESGLKASDTSLAQTLREEATAIKGWAQSWDPAISAQKQFQAELAKTDQLMKQNAANARNASSARTGSFLGQQESGLKARDTTFAATLRDEAKASETASQQAAIYNQYLYDQEKAAGAAQGNLQAQRYALYEVARAYTAVGLAMTGAGIYAAVVGAQFESAFTNVQRTLDGVDLEESFGSVESGVEAIRERLIDLTGQIPLTFEEIAKIATIGNQMGIAADGVVGFTETIARFASVSGMSIDAVSQAFGGFAAQTGLDSKYFENLGSAIALVGIKSNATEAQIISVTRELAAGASQAGFTADQIVGLSGTLASLQVPPERARGSLDTYFGTLAKSVAEGGEKLQNFATIVGVTSDQLATMVRNGQGADVLKGFLENLQNLDNVDVTKAFDELGLSGLRVSNTFTRLSSDVEQFTGYMDLARNAFVEGSELNRQYEMTIDDLSSQWIIFTNNLNALIEVVSGGAVTSISGLVMAVNDALIGFRKWLGDNRWAIALAGFAGVMMTVIGTFALFKGVTAAANASLLAFQFMAQRTGGAAAGSLGGLRTMAAGLAGVEVNAKRSVIALGLFKRALAATGVGLLVTGIGMIAGEMMKVDDGSKSAALSQQQYLDAVKGAGRASAGAADDAGNLADQLSGGGSGGGGGSVAKAAKEAAAQIRTLVDYVSDLSGVFKRSGDIRFGSGSAQDAITSKWREMREAAEEYQRTVNELTADRDIKAYWLSIAEAYDDQLRAGVLRADLAKTDKELADAQAGASKELEGNSKAAIENRRQIRDLLSNYESYITALANAGASQEEIQAVIQALGSDFRQQAADLGFSSSEIETFAARFGDFGKIVASVPRDITIDFNADPALQALAEFQAKLDQAKSQAEEVGRGIGEGVGGGIGGGIGDTMPSELDWSALEDDAASAGDDVGKSFWERLGSVLRDASANFIKKSGLGSVFQEIGNFFRDVFGVEGGKMGADGFNTGFKTNFGIKTIVIEGVAAAQDPVSREWVTLASENTIAYQNGLTQNLDPKSPLAAALAIAKVQADNDAAAIGESNATTYSDKLNKIDASAIYKKIQDEENRAKQASKSVGDSSGSEATKGINEKTSASGITASIYAQSQAAKDAAASVGSGVGKSLGDSLKSSFDTIVSTLKVQASLLGGKSTSGRANGGYTGPGGKYDVAGQVHRGEYVIPAQYVNQRTGVPDIGYVQSLQRGKAPAPVTSGFANGGFTGSAFGGVVELGPITMSGIARALAVELNVDGKALARNTSRGDAQLAGIGTN